MFSCSCSKSYSLVHCSVLSVSVTASVQYLIPSSSYSLSLFICFPPSLLFITLMKKKMRENALNIFRGGRQVLAEAKKREMKRGKAREGRDTQREKMQYDVPLQCQLTKIFILCKRGLRATQNKGSF